MVLLSRLDGAGELTYLRGNQKCRVLLHTPAPAGWVSQTGAHSGVRYAPHILCVPSRLNFSFPVYLLKRGFPAGSILSQCTAHGAFGESLRDSASVTHHTLALSAIPLAYDRAVWGRTRN